MQHVPLILLAIAVGAISNTARGDILAGWDVDLSSLDAAQVAAGIASAQSLNGTAVASEVSILSGGPGGNGVDLNNVFSSITTPTGIEIGLDNTGVGSSNLYRGIFAARDWFIEGNDSNGDPFPIDPTKFLSFQIDATSGLDLNTFELVARKQVMNTPSRVRNVYAAFSTDGVNFADYVAPSADGDPSDDTVEDPPSELQGNFLVGPRGGPLEPTLNPHKIWDLSDYSGVSSFWIRVQARGLPNSSGESVLNPDSWFAIDDRGDLDTDSPLDIEANANNPFSGPFDSGESEDGFDVILTGAVALGLPGDFNGDGHVGLADYTVWRDNLGATEDEGVLSGNGNGGTVDATDYARWRDNFGAGPGMVVQATTTVPEPTAIAGMLSLISMAAVVRQL